MDYKEAWNDQKKFMKLSITWMDATINNAKSDEEKLQALAKKHALKLMLERMESTEEMQID